MQTRSSDENSVCLSVRPSVCAAADCRQNEDCGVIGTQIIHVFCCVAECLIAPPRYPDIVTVTTRPLPLPPVYPATALPRPYPLFAPSRSAIQLLTGGVATETSTGEISINFL